MKVADLGAGSGHYAAAAAAIVNPGGKVYAVEIQQDLHKHIKEHAHERHSHIIEPVWGDIERLGGSRLRDQSIDAVILANVLFQVENRFGVLAEVKRIIRPGGKLLVVDWAGPYGGMGPAAEKVVPEHEAEALFINGGFHKERSLRAGPHHYGIIFNAPL
jgi:ubiquinone/menaquinone biosynthesis C-methylase UbiE